jgi:hydrogenase expression/formation protein HypC
MCLAVPGRVLEVHRDRELLVGRVDFGGAARTVCLETVPDVQPGDYVLVHVGLAIGRIDEDEAERLLALFASLPDLDEGRPT